MPSNVFISDRRQDASKDARAISERLRREFGGQRVFIDLDGIEPGEDFVELLERQLDHCEVLVALIGRDWADAKNELGQRRQALPLDHAKFDADLSRLARAIHKAVAPPSAPAAPAGVDEQAAGDKRIRRQAPCAPLSWPLLRCRPWPLIGSSHPTARRAAPGACQHRRTCHRRTCHRHGTARGASRGRPVRAAEDRVRVCGFGG